MPRTAKGPYAFPLLDQDRYRAKIQFQALNVRPPSFGENLNLVVPAVGEAFKSATNLSRENQEDKDKASAEAGAGIVAQSRAAAASTSLQTNPIQGERATIYLPVSITFDDRLQYNTPNLDVMGSTVLAGLNQGSGLLASATSAIEQGFASITDMFQGNFPSTQAAALAAYRASKSIPFVPDSVRNAISVAGRVTLNPNTVAAFGSVGLRTFTYQFKFIPKSRDEAEEVKKIIYFFRKNAYPEKIGGLVGYKFPNMFRIRLLYQVEGVNSYFKSIGTGILDSYLQSVTTNYNPTTMAFHPDGNPVEIDVSLTFIEHRTLSKSDITLEADPVRNLDYDISSSEDYYT